MLDYRNLNECASFKKLQNAPRGIVKNLLSPETVKSNQLPIGGGLMYNYAAKGISSQVLSILCELASEQQILQKYEAVLCGEMMNTGEKRKVLHQLSRGQLLADVVHNGKNLRDFYVHQQDKVTDFAHKVHTGQIKGSTGKVFDTVVQIGIGGSDLGPRALSLALQNLYLPKMHAHFISNVDPDDANAILETLNLETTLFIVVSKSGTTQETLTNHHFVIETANKQNIPGYQPNRHFVAVTSESSPMAKNPDFLASFFIDDFIGGRYSSTSAVGGVVLTLAFGAEVFDELLAGAHDADRMALNPNFEKNATVLDALIGVYERNILGYPCSAVLPYSQALSRFPAHLQQLDMESNGKCVNRNGLPVNYQTGPIIFGEPGTNGQHSFYQLLHQGTDIVPLQFIGFLHSQMQGDIEFEGSTSQTKLNANLLAQILAFALGKEDRDPNKTFAGDRPSSLIFGEKLNARALGALLAHFENKIMFQGFIWNLNSFDQEGVQLGKVLTNKILARQTDSLGQAFMALLDL